MAMKSWEQMDEFERNAMRAEGFRNVQGPERDAMIAGSRAAGMADAREAETRGYQGVAGSGVAGTNYYGFATTRKPPEPKDVMGDFHQVTLKKDPATGEIKETRTRTHAMEAGKAPGGQPAAGASAMSEAGGGARAAAPTVTPDQVSQIMAPAPVPVQQAAPAALQERLIRPDAMGAPMTPHEMWKAGQISTSDYLNASTAGAGVTTTGSSVADRGHRQRMGEARGRYDAMGERGLRANRDFNAAAAAQNAGQAEAAGRAEVARIGGEARVQAVDARGNWEIEKERLRGENRTAVTTLLNQGRIEEANIKAFSYKTVAEINQETDTAVAELSRQGKVEAARILAQNKGKIDPMVWLSATDAQRTQLLRAIRGAGATGGGVAGAQPTAAEGSGGSTGPALPGNGAGSGAALAPPAVGTTKPDRNGVNRRFKGGNPSDPTNWEAI